MSLVMIKLCFNYAVKFFFVMIMTFSSSPVMFPELNMWYLKLFKAIRVLSSSFSSYSRHFPFSVFNFFLGFFSLHGFNPNPHHYYHHLSSSLLISKWYLVPTYIYTMATTIEEKKKDTKLIFIRKRDPHDLLFFLLRTKEKIERYKILILGLYERFGLWESCKINWNWGSLLSFMNPLLHQNKYPEFKLLKKIKEAKPITHLQSLLLMNFTNSAYAFILIFFVSSLYDVVAAL